jgi:hypothetical protein
MELTATGTYNALTLTHSAIGSGSPLYCTTSGTGDCIHALSSVGSGGIAAIYGEASGNGVAAMYAKGTGNGSIGLLAESSNAPGNGSVYLWQKGTGELLAGQRTNATAGNLIDFTQRKDGQDVRVFLLDELGRMAMGQGVAIDPFNMLYASSSIAMGGIKLETSDGGNQGPYITLYHNSGSPSAADKVGTLQFIGEDNLGNQTTYAQFQGGINNLNGASSSGSARINVLNAGSFETAVDIYGGATDTVKFNYAPMLAVQGGAQPTCDSTIRGTLWLMDSGGGVDTIEACVSTAGGYSWETVF